MIRRINLYAGPCSGKSTTALRLCGDLKYKGYNIELVDEFVKQWAFLGLKPSGFDQLLIFANQMYKEEIVLKNGVRHIISDSPLFLSACYCKKFCPEMYEPLLELQKLFEKNYPSLNIFLLRGNKTYSKIGRYQTYEEAIELDNFIETELISSGKNYYSYNFEDYDGISALVEGNLVT